MSFMFDVVFDWCQSAVTNTVYRETIRMGFLILKVYFITTVGKARPAGQKPARPNIKSDLSDSEVLTFVYKFIYKLLNIFEHDISYH